VSGPLVGQHRRNPELGARIVTGAMRDVIRIVVVGVVGLADDPEAEEESPPFAEEGQEER